MTEYLLNFGLFQTWDLSIPSEHADIDADGTIDHVHCVVNPGEAGPGQEEGGPDCYGKATSMAAATSAKVLYGVVTITLVWKVIETFCSCKKGLSADVFRSKDIFRTKLCYY